MRYTVAYAEQTARVNYFGDVTTDDIREAHFELNGDSRFYECRNLILDATSCDLERVEVSGMDMTEVIATDLGASKSMGALKVAMIAVSEVNRARIGEYIERMKVSPWEVRMFSSVEEAGGWLRLGERAVLDG